MTCNEAYRRLNAEYFNLPDGMENKSDFNDGYVTGFAAALNKLEALLLEGEK